jgi:hypothetical protein
MFVILAVSLLSASVVRAQQPAVPGSSTLYAQMIAAMQQAGSVHVQQTTAMLPLGPHQTIRQAVSGTADVSAQQRLLRIVYTTKVSSVRTGKVLVNQRTRFVAVDDRYAQQIDGTQWYCAPLGPEYWQSDALSVFTVLPTSPHFIGAVTPASVLGTAVWRVKIDLGNRTDVLNIAQNTYRLVRVTESSGVKTAADGARKTFTDFTRYGEVVTAKLPQACRP